MSKDPLCLNRHRLSPGEQGASECGSVSQCPAQSLEVRVPTQKGHSFINLRKMSSSPLYLQRTKSRHTVTGHTGPHQERLVASLKDRNIHPTKETRGLLEPNLGAALSPGALFLRLLCVTLISSSELWSKNFQHLAQTMHPDQT